MDHIKGFKIFIYFGMLCDYLHISPVCYPSSQLLSRKASNLQLIGIRPARFPFGWEVEEGWSRIHIKLQHKYRQNVDRGAHIFWACKLLLE